MPGCPRQLEVEGWGEEGGKFVGGDKGGCWDVEGCGVVGGDGKGGRGKGWGDDG